MNRQDIITHLSKGIHTVNFTKLNGEERIMTCTLDPQFLPIFEGKSVPKPLSDKQLENISVWDTVALAWRSFKCNRINTIDNSVVDYVETEQEPISQNGKQQNRIDISIGDA
jgi:hypothetical protein